MTENPTLRFNRMLLIMAAGGVVRDDVLREAEREAQAAGIQMGHTGTFEALNNEAAA